MSIIARLALPADLDAICGIYDRIHTAEENGLIHSGWIRNVYPTPNIAMAALQKRELFVQEKDGIITGTAIINQLQPDAYAKTIWEHRAKDDQVTVLHTFMIDPAVKASGLGTKFMEFYESLAISRQAPFLRMDTNAINTEARRFYKKMGFTERGIVQCAFNNLGNVNLVMLEKKAAA